MIISRLERIEGQFQGLKGQTHEVLRFSKELQASKADFEAANFEAGESNKSTSNFCILGWKTHLRLELQSAIDDNGVYIPTGEWRAAIEQIRLEFANSKLHMTRNKPYIDVPMILGQHVLDMFRDKLEFAQGELAESKNRLAELEGKQEHDAHALEAAYRQISSLSEPEYLLCNLHS